MNEDGDRLRAMHAAWMAWHAGMDVDDVPMPNPSFCRGFAAGCDYARQRDAETRGDPQ